MYTEGTLYNVHQLCGKNLLHMFYKVLLMFAVSIHQSPQAHPTFLHCCVKNKKLFS